MAAEALWAPVALRLLRATASKTAAAARQKVAAAIRPLTNSLPIVAAQPVAIPISSSPSSTLRRARPIDDILRRFLSSLSSPASRSAYTKARPSIADEAFSRFARSTRRAPFASTLRPSLTGGAFPRSAGGYGLGAGGARYFSHGPAAPAEVVHNVSQAMRAFVLNGKRARYDGLNTRGEKRYRAVSAVEDDAARRLAAAAKARCPAPGAYIDFRLSPTVTATSSLLTAAFPYVRVSSSSSSDEAIAATPTTLNTDGFLDFLAGDFARAARDLATVLADLKRLAHLGDLPISMEGPSVLRVRFPGVDAETVERLCEDAGLCRGFVGEDVAFRDDPAVAVALRFPFAPDGGGANDARTPTSPGGSLRSRTGYTLENDDCGYDSCDEFFEEAYLDEFAARPWLSDPESSSGSSRPVATPAGSSAAEYEGVEGIYRFIEACDRAQGRF